MAQKQTVTFNREQLLALGRSVVMVDGYRGIAVLVTDAEHDDTLVKATVNAIRRGVVDADEWTPAEQVSVAHKLLDDGRVIDLRTHDPITVALNARREPIATFTLE